MIAGSDRKDFVDTDKKRVIYAYLRRYHWRSFALAMNV